MTTLNLHTGLPGASKTLFTIHHVKQMVEREKAEHEKAGKAYPHEVYFYNIRGCRVPGWIEIEDAKKWHELPTGAIIIIDEAQDIFRPRATGSTVPEHVALLEKHRHKGYRIFLITQHPMLLDNNVRRLVTKHRHMVRAFGKSYATCHEWDKCKEQCDKNRDDSIKTPFPYPKEVFDLYDSAEIHTVKGNLPWRVAFLFVIPILLVACAYMLYAWWAPRLSEDQLKSKIQASSQHAPGATLGGGAPAPGPQKTPAQWMAEQQARVPGLPHTAPIYDGVTQPVQAPYPAACVSSKSRGCVCYSQQGTLLDTPQEMCQGIVQRGFFVAFDTSKGREAQQQQQPQQYQQPHQEQPATVRGDAVILSPASMTGKKT